MSRERRQPTDRELGDMVRYFARVCLEVERGLRSPDQLDRIMKPSIATRLVKSPKLGHYRDGPVRPGDLGPPRIERTERGPVHASITTRTEGGRWGALILQLEEHRARWRVADMQRVLAAMHYRYSGRSVEQLGGRAR